MKLVGYELKKVLCKRAFIIIFAFAFIINAALCYYSENTDENQNYILESELYNNLVNEYKNMPINDAEESIEDEVLAYTILDTMKCMADAQSEEELDIYNQELEDYKKDSPEVYAKAESLNASGSTDYARQIFIYDLQNQIEYIKSYPEFIDEMYDRAAEQSKYSAFSDGNSFSYKNLFKTADDYSHLTDVRLQIYNSKTTAALENNTVTDILILGLIFLACIYLFYSEKGKGLYSLVRSASYGRVKTAFAKLAALLVLAAAVTLIFFAADVVTVSCVYGLGDFSASIQSLSQYRNCTLNVSVGGFLAYSAFTKFVGAAVTGVIFAAIFVLSKSSGVMYVANFCITAAEFFAYALIPSDSPINYFKYINIFYIMDSGEFWGKYSNLNIFSVPICAQAAAIVVLFAVFAACSAASAIHFSRNSLEKRDGFSAIIAEKVKSKLYKISGSTGLLRAELHKYFITNKMLVFVLAVVAFGVFNSFGSVAYSYSDMSDYEYKTYMEELEGDVTPEKITFIESEKEYFDGLQNRLQEIETDSSLTDNAKQVLANTISNTIATKGAAFDRVLEQYDRIMSLSDSGAAPRFINEITYDSFVSNGAREWKDFAIFAVLIIILLPPIFTAEYKNNLINLIRPTEKGKLNLAADKLIISIIVTTLAYAAVYLPYYIRFINTYGTESFATSLMCLYADASQNISVIAAVIVKQLMYYFAGILAAAFISFLSVNLKNNLLVMITASVFVFVPLLVVYGNESIRLGTIIKNNNVSVTLIIIAILTVLTIALTVACVRKFTACRGRWHYAQA